MYAVIETGPKQYRVTFGEQATVIGLRTHIAEHTQRHVGPPISAAKWVRVEV